MKINDIINEGKTGPGLWANINAKRKRGAKMRKKGDPGAPTEKALKAAQAGSKNESVSEDKDPCWDNYKQVGMKTKGGHKVPNCVPKEGVAEGLSKRDQQDVAAIRAAIARLESQLNHPNADKAAIQQSIAHEKKRLALYGVTEAAYNPDTFVGKKGTYKGYGITQEGPYQWGISSSARKFPTLNAVKRHIDKNLVAEGGIGDKIKGAVKSVKRASQGWGAGGESDAVSPKDVVQAFGKMDGQRLANFVASRKDLSKPRNNSARAFADKVIDREMRQRGYGRVAGKDEQGVADKGSQLEETYHDDDEFFEAYGVMEYNDEMINEAEYQGRKVTLNKPMRGDVKKFAVYVKNPKGNVVKVNFGQKGARIKKNNPGRRKNFRARHNCDNPGPKTGARYWSCRKW